MQRGDTAKEVIVERAVAIEQAIFDKFDQSVDDKYRQSECETWVKVGQRNPSYKPGTPAIASSREPRAVSQFTRKGERRAT
jgi:hypothetical protein